MKTFTGSKAVPGSGPSRSGGRNEHSQAKPVNTAPTINASTASRALDFTLAMLIFVAFSAVRTLDDWFLLKSSEFGACIRGRTGIHGTPRVRRFHAGTYRLTAMSLECRRVCATS